MRGVFRAEAGERLPAVLFGLACVVGLGGAFVGLTASSFWIDELFTTWAVGHDGSLAGVANRALTDSNPPLYYFVVFGFTRVFGGSDLAFRVFSVLCACAAIVVFVAATARSFSLPARLFAGAMATGSMFWFAQSQNARAYALALLLGAGVLALSLRSLRQEKVSNALTGLLFVALILLSLTHFYGLLIGVADLLCLSVLVKRQRLTMAALALLLLGLGEAYIAFALKPFTQVSIGNSWIGNTPSWYWGQLQSASAMSLDTWGAWALAICFAALLFQLAHQRIAVVRRVATREALLCLGVMVLVFAGGVVSSSLTEPNFSDRNLLVASPFLWGFYACLYDAAVPTLSALPRRAAFLALCAIVLVMSAIVGTRDLPRTEPFRESAAWIQRFPQCRGAKILAINPSPAAWYKPGYAERVKASEYGRYLGAFAQPRMVFAADILASSLPPDLRAELARRAVGQGCPVLAWAPRGLSLEDLPQLVSKLFPGGTHVSVQTFRTYSGGLRPKPYGPQGYVITALPE